MPSQCELTGKHVQFGNKVSHSNRKTRRPFAPNFRNITLESKVLNRSFRIQIAVSTLRTVDFKGGLDAFLVGTKAAKLTPFAQKIRRDVKKIVGKPQKPCDDA
ncbi:MAG: 50S ribosomal protein L28 [Rickettsiales bacterium]